MKPRLFNQESKMRLINQQLYKKAKIDLKKLRLQQQIQKPSININIVNNIGGLMGRTQRIKDIKNKMELITPQEKELHQKIYESKIGVRPKNMPEFIGNINDDFDGKSSLYSDIEPKNIMGFINEGRESINAPLSDDSRIDDLINVGFSRKEANKIKISEIKKQGYMMNDSSSGFVSESEGDLSELSGITRRKNSIYDVGSADLT